MHSLAALDARGRRRAPLRRRTRGCRGGRCATGRACGSRTTSAPRAGAISRARSPAPGCARRSSCRSAAGSRCWARCSSRRRPPRLQRTTTSRSRRSWPRAFSAALETSRRYQALADERSTLAAVLGSTAGRGHHDEPGRRRPARQRGGARRCWGWRPTRIDGPAAAGGRRLRAAAPALREERRPADPELPLPDGRTAQASLVPVTHRRSASPSAWRRSCATSRCSRTSSR